MLSALIFVQLLVPAAAAYSGGLCAVSSALLCSSSSVFSANFPACKRKIHQVPSEQYTCMSPGARAIAALAVLPVLAIHLG